MVTNNSDLEELSAKIHQVYCQFKREVHGEDYWTGGDYSKLDEEWKEADRYMARFFLSQLTTKDQEITQLKGEVERLRAQRILLCEAADDAFHWIDEVITSGIPAGAPRDKAKDIARALDNALAAPNQPNHKG